MDKYFRALGRLSLLVILIGGITAPSVSIAQDKINPPWQIANYNPCCMLGPSQGFLFDLESLKYRITEGYGVVYTKKAGFIDLGHLRYTVYLTKYVYDQIRVAKGSQGTVVTRTSKAALEGTATVHTQIPIEMWSKVARSISFDSSVAYEIETWNLYCHTCHNSSFSPEDLVSNYLGTYVAETALNLSSLTGISFEKAVTQTTFELIQAFVPLDKNKTTEAFDRVNGCWMDFQSDMSYQNTKYLKRRNFDLKPVKWWDAERGIASALPELVTGLEDADRYYTYVYHIRGFKVSSRELLQRIETIRKAATKKYGRKADSPDCK